MVGVMVMGAKPFRGGGSRERGSTEWQYICNWPTQGLLFGSWPSGASGATPNGEHVGAVDEEAWDIYREIHKSLRG